MRQALEQFHRKRKSKVLRNKLSTRKIAPPWGVLLGISKGQSCYCGPGVLGVLRVGSSPATPWRVAVLLLLLVPRQEIDWVLLWVLGAEYLTPN